jgi:hypothetical protein
LDSNFTNLNTDKLEINAALGTPASVTLTNATGLPTAGLVDNAVTNEKLRDSAGLSVIGRGANSTGDPADIVAGTNHQVLRRDGSSLGFGAVDLSSNQAVTGTLPVNQGGTGITSFGAGVATWLGTPSSANLAAAVTDETGTGALVFANSPTLVTPALGTPASGVVTNLTGTASININGTVGATTPAAGAFTTLSATTSVSTPSDFIGTGGAASSIVLYNNNSTGSALLSDGVGAAYVAVYNTTHATKASLVEVVAGGALRGLFSSNGLEIKSKLAVGYSDFSGIPTNGAAFAGSVGIGTSSPAGRLDVSQAAVNVNQFLRNTSALTTGNTSTLWLGNGTTSFGASDDQWGWSSYAIDGSTTRLELSHWNGSGYSVPITISTSGNLGLGVTPSAWFTSNNTKAFQLGGGAVVSYLNNQVWLTNNYLLSAAGADVYEGNGAALRFIMDGAYKFQTAPNNVSGAGASATLTERVRIDSDGIKFNGDTAAANALDDYEEGLFQPTATPSTSGSWTLNAANNMSYTKVGRLVTITGLFYLGTGTSPVGTFLILGNLPFAIANPAEQYPARIGFGAVLIRTGALVPCIASEGATTISLLIDNSAISNNDEFGFTFSYITA